MQKLKIWLVFISLVILRWVSLDSPLPPSWTPNMDLKITALVTEPVEYTDSKTIIKRGIWEFQLDGYAVIIPGSEVVFVGKVTPKVLGNKVIRIVMKNPTFEVISSSGSLSIFNSGSLMVVIGQLRERLVGILEKNLPEPMSSLAAGILLGSEVKTSKQFQEQLINSGTIHIVAASGYNVNIIASVAMKIFGIVLSRGMAIILALSGIVFYVCLTGASASVVRAAIMGSFTLSAYYLGRPTSARRILWITVFVMLFLNPRLSVDIGFQLSVAATVGILYIEPMLELILVKFKILEIGRELLANYLLPTLAANITTLPVIIWYFGRISWISPLTNILILPLVPLTMGLTSLVVLLGMINDHLGQGLAWLLYAPLLWIVRVIEWGGK